MSGPIRLLAVLFGCVVLVTGCGDHSVKSSASAAGAAKAAPSAAASAAAPMYGAAAGSSAEASSGGAQVANAPLQTREVVSTASMTVQTAQVDQAADTLSADAARLGGFVDQDDRSDTDTPSAQLILCVVPTRLTQLMSDADRLGHESVRTVTATDVTASVADVGARVSALRTSVGRLQALMGTSANLNDLISLENQLTQRQASLDSTVAQQRALADQTSLARLTVNLAPPVAPPAKPRAATHHVTAFSAAVRGGARAFAFMVRLFLAGLGYALPFLGVPVVAAGLGWWLRHRRRAPADESLA